MSGPFFQNQKVFWDSLLMKEDMLNFIFLESNLNKGRKYSREKMAKKSHTKQLKKLLRNILKTQFPIQSK